MITSFHIFEKTIGDQFFYDIDDYVLIDIIDTDKNMRNMMAKIIHVRYNTSYKFPYKVEFYDDTTMNISADEIYRKLTPEEISDFYAKKDSFKYNL